MHHAPCTMHHAPCTMHHAPHTHTSPAITRYHAINVTTQIEARSVFGACIERITEKVIHLRLVC
jgi:hypothetical protein